MVIVTTQEEKEKLKNKEITVEDIIKNRGHVADKYNPPKLDKYDQVKLEIREANKRYNDLIQENRELRELTKKNVENKRKIRLEIERLRLKKKKMVIK